MRKWMFRIGWAVVFVVPVIYSVQIYLTQDLPRVEPWQWFILLSAVIVIYVSRDRDDVLRHHVVG